MSTNYDSSTGVNAARGPNGTQGGQFQELLTGVEELIDQIARVESPEIQKIRAKAQVALVAARSAVKDSAAHIKKQAREMATTADDSVRNSPWQSLAVGTLVGLAVGFAIGRKPFGE